MPVPNDTKINGNEIQWRITHHGPNREDKYTLSIDKHGYIAGISGTGKKTVNTRQSESWPGDWNLEIIGGLQTRLTTGREFKQPKLLGDGRREEIYTDANGRKSTRLFLPDGTFV